MPLGTDWTPDTASVNATLNVIHYTTNALEGNRSLRIEATTGGAATPYATGGIYLVTPPYTRGFPMGRVRTIIRRDGPEHTHAGIYCLASQAVGIAQAGSCYIFGPRSNNRIVLQKITAGGLGGVPTQLFDTGEILTSTSVSDVNTLELAWKASVPIFGGVQFLMSVGELADFSDLTLVGDYTDSFDPLLTSSAEGIYAHVTGILLSMAFTFDMTRVQRTDQTA